MSRATAAAAAPRRARDARRGVGGGRLPACRVRAACGARRALDSRRRQRAARRTRPRERRAGAGGAARARRAARCRHDRRAARQRGHGGRPARGLRARRCADARSSACAWCRALVANRWHVLRSRAARRVRSLAAARRCERVPADRCRRASMIEQARTAAPMAARRPRPLPPRGSLRDAGGPRSTPTYSAKAFAVALARARRAPDEQRPLLANLRRAMAVARRRHDAATAFATRTESRDDRRASRSRVPHLSRRLRHARAREPRHDARLPRARAVGAARARGGGRRARLRRRCPSTRWCGTWTSTTSRSRCPATTSPSAAGCSPCGTRATS